MATRRPAEIFPPGEFIKDELEERGWTQEDLAAILGRTQATISQLIASKRSITPEIAKGLAAAFNTTPQFWLNLEAALQLWRVQNDTTDTVARRARLYTYAPVKDMERRGWIEHSNDVGIMEERVRSFYGMPDLSEPPTFLAYAARKSTSYEKVTASQCAWLFRAMQLSRFVRAAKYDSAKLPAAIESLQLLIAAPQETRHVPRVLSEYGIRFVIVEDLPGTKIDGASFWIDTEPVIAMSLRYDRNDNFWFTLMHEVGHLAQRDEGLDVDTLAVRIDTDRLDNERTADEFATEHLVPQGQLESFIARVSPLYTAERIEGFAIRCGVHPGIVVGQLQHRNEIMWTNFRRLLASVRSYVMQGAIADGYGASFPA